MADSDAVHRVPMTMPGAQYTVQVPEADVEHRLEMGWVKTRAKRGSGSGTDTGTVPVQRTDPR
jgi:hypothetical protein